MAVKRQQIDDWAENPVTEALRELIKKELEDISSMSVTDCLVAGNPTQSHENLAELEARERVWGYLREFLNGDWTYFEEEEAEDERDTKTGY